VAARAQQPALPVILPRPAGCNDEGQF